MWVVTLRGIGGDELETWDPFTLSCYYIKVEIREIWWVDEYLPPCLLLYLLAESVDTKTYNVHVNDRD